VREALLMLELQGTVDIRQGSGVYVMRIPHEHESEEERCSAAMSARLKSCRRASCWRATSPPLPPKWPPAPISITCADY
jgi:DNA-binding GntR family transcriptional regulator